MKVFVGKNILANAAGTCGLCADVVREVFASHELLFSDQVLTEFPPVLRLKFRVGQDLSNFFIWLLGQDSVPAQPGMLPRIELK